MRRFALLIFAVIVAVSCMSPAPVVVPATTAPATVSPSSSPASTTSPVAATSSASPTSPSASPGGSITQISAIQRLDARVGWVSANAEAVFVLLRTSDGGATWQSLPTLGAVFTKLVFVHARAGWAIASTPPTCRQPGANPCTTAIFATADGGDHWNEIFRAADDLSRGPAIVDLAAIDAQHAWTVLRTTQCDPEGCAHQVLGTDDGGAHWKVLREPQIATRIVRTSVTRGWLLGSGSPANGGPIVGTSDAGATWNQQYQSSLQPVLLTARSDRAAWALYRDPSQCTASSCSSNDLVRTTDGSTWTKLGDPRASAASSGCGGFLSQISFGDEKTGWITANLGAGGAQGTGGVLRTTDGGSSWTCQTNPANTVLVSAASAQNAWITSSERGTNKDTLWTSDDGGGTWNQVQIVVR